MTAKPQKRRVVTSYSGSELAAMEALLTRESGGVAPDMDAVAEELLGALWAIGLAFDGTEENAIWHELSTRKNRRFYGVLGL